MVARCLERERESVAEKRLARRSSAAAAAAAAAAPRLAVSKPAGALTAAWPASSAETYISGANHHVSTRRPSRRIESCSRAVVHSSRGTPVGGGVVYYGLAQIVEALGSPASCSRQPGRGMECPAMLCAVAMSRTRGIRDNLLPWHGNPGLLHYHSRVAVPCQMLNVVE